MNDFLIGDVVRVRPRDGVAWIGIVIAVSLLDDMGNATYTVDDGNPLDHHRAVLYAGAFMEDVLIRPRTWEEKIETYNRHMRRVGDPHPFFIDPARGLTEEFLRYIETQVLGSGAAIEDYTPEIMPLLLAEIRRLWAEKEGQK